MKKILLLVACLFSISLFSQTISGKLVDEKGNGLPYATIQLLKSDSSIHKLETSNVDGSFLFKNLKREKYFLGVTFVGYASLNRMVDLTAGTGQLGTLDMQLQSTDLQEVTVSAEKPLIQIEPDKTVFNVSKNLSTAGDNGVDLLRKAPGLQIDNDDNIIVEGKSGVNIYINGKQSFLQGEDLKNYLRSLNADEIESVEIITQPSSKYDAAGSAGILNIVLKREKGLGMKGTITNTLTLGDYARNNTALTLNYRNKKYALFGSLSHFEGRSTGFFDLYREQADNVFDLETRTINTFNNYSLNMGGDYYLNNNSTLSFSVNGNISDSENDPNSRTSIAKTDDFVIDSILLAPNQNDNEVENLTTNINYTFKDTSGRTFSVDFDYVNYESIGESYQPNIYVSPDESITLSQNINFQETPIDINVYSSQIDYEQKLWKGVIAMGAKSSRVITNNIFDFYDVEDDVRLINDSSSNTFEYTETIIAGYVNYKYKLKKWNFQAGLRAEQTFSKGDLESVTQTANKVVEREYLNWFPSGGVTYQANRNNSLALIYSRRIQRPNYRNLNPFESQVNELSFRRGNPFLQPQFTHNLKISNTYKYTLNTSFTFSYVNDFFAEVTEAEGDKKAFINTRNVADQQNYNLSVSYPKRLKEWWSVYGSIYGYYTKFTANHPDFIPIDRIVYGGYAQSTFTLPKDYKFEVSGWYSSPSIWRGTFKTESIGSLNLALQKNWNNWNFKFSYNDVLYTIPWRANNRFGDLFITGTGGSDSRNVRFYVSYAFGHNDVKTARQRKSSSEEERGRIQ